MGRAAAIRSTVQKFRISARDFLVTIFSAEASPAASSVAPKTLPETKSLTRRGFVANVLPSHAVVRRSEWEDDEHGMDARGPTPLCTGHPGDRQAGHAGPPGGHDRHHPSPFVRRSAA